MTLRERLTDVEASSVSAEAALAGRLGAVNGNGSAEHAHRDPYSGVKNRVHRAVIDKLGTRLAGAADADLREWVHEAVEQEMAGDRTPLSRDERAAARARDRRRHPRLRPARARCSRDDTVTEVMVNGCDRIFVERDGKLERDRRALPRRRASHAHHRQDRLAGRPAHRRGLADGRRPPARRQPRQRDHPAALARGPDADDPQVLARPATRSTT